MASKTSYDVACEVLDGKWGNGTERYRRINAAGFSYEAVQSIVNCLIKDRNREAASGNFEKFLTVEVDLDEYDGLNLKFKKKG
jgi:hypothetical protein